MAFENAAELTGRERRLTLALLAAFFAFGLFDHGLWSPNDSREGAMIWDMYRSGRWVTPSLNGAAYLEKPPLLHWLGLVFCLLLGGVHEGLVRLPAALFGLGGVLLLWRWGREMGRERAGMAAAFMCASTLMYLHYAKIVLTDMALVFVVMFSVDRFWQAWRRPSRGRWFVFLLVSAAAFYAKGLLGTGFVWVGVTLFLWLRREWKRWLILCLLFMPVFALVLAPWVYALWRAGGWDYLETVFWANQAGRFLSFSDPNLPRDPYFYHKEPVYFYLKQIPVILLPWVGLAVPAAVWWAAQGRRAAQGILPLLGCVLLGMLAVLHVSSAKAGAYFLPVFPPLFLITALWLEQAARWWRSRTCRALTCFTAGLIALALALLVVAPIGYLAAAALGLFKAAPVGGLRTAVSLALAAAAAWCLRLEVLRLWKRWQQGDRTGVLLALPVSAVLVLIPAAAGNIPWFDFQRSYVPFADAVREQVRPGPALALAVGQEDSIGAFTFYLDARLPVLDATAAAIAGFMQAPGRRGVIVRTKHLAGLLPGACPEGCRVMEVLHPGYKSRSYRLLIREG